MRIALVAPPYESVPPSRYGGTERVVDLLARGLSQRGIDVTVYATGDSRTAGKLRAVIPEGLRHQRHLLLLGSGPIHLQFLAAVEKDAEQFDLIHNHDDFWMLPLLAARKVPMLSTLHGRLDLPFLRETYDAFPQAWHGMISISHAQRKPMPDLPWVANIPHGLELENIRARLDGTPAPRGEYLAFLGRFSPEKGAAEAVQIALQSGMPLRIAAKIEGTEMQQYFDEHIKPYLDGRNIEYVGEIGDQDKDEFLGNAAALLFPIDWPEPFGLVMIEALARGTPVLARPCGSVPEILSDGVTGFIDRDLSILSNKVRDLHRISRTACRARVEERFSLDRMIEDHLHAYRIAVESPTRSTRPGNVDARLDARVATTG